MRPIPRAPVSSSPPFPSLPSILPPTQGSPFSLLIFFNWPLDTPFPIAYDLRGALPFLGFVSSPVVVSAVRARGLALTLSNLPPLTKTFTASPFASPQNPSYSQWKCLFLSHMPSRSPTKASRCARPSKGRARLCTPSQS